LTNEDTDFLFDFIKNGNEMSFCDLELDDLLDVSNPEATETHLENKQKNEYIKLVAKIVNSFLEYGFLNGPKR
jgi:hypothetical protein